MLQRFDEATGLALWKAPNGPVGKLSETERVTYAQLEASKAQLLIAKAGRPDAAGVLECLERDGLGPNREAIDIADEEKPRRVTALSIAAQVGCAENVAVLLDWGAVVDWTSDCNHRRTPLFYACRGGHEDVVRQLLEARASVTAARDARSGASALHETMVSQECADSHLRCARLLIEHGADVDLPVHEDGSTPLIAACCLGANAFVNMLLEARANVAASLHNLTASDGQTFNGQTALMVAAEQAEFRVVQTLLEAGAAHASVTSHGWTALSFASAAGNTPAARRCVTLLREARRDAGRLAAPPTAEAAAAADAMAALLLAEEEGPAPVPNASKRSQKKKKTRKASSTPADMAPEASPRDGGAGLCVVCMDTPSCMAFVPCGHVCSCGKCASSLASCPICRKTIASRLRIYPS